MALLNSNLFLPRHFNGEVPGLGFCIETLTILTVKAIHLTHGLATAPLLAHNLGLHQDVTSNSS
jgi:hypothetical protein